MSDGNWSAGGNWKRVLKPWKSDMVGICFKDMKIMGELLFSIAFLNKSQGLFSPVLNLMIYDELSSLVDHL